jgi:hypothetical protein
VTIQTIRRRLNKLHRFSPGTESSYPICSCCEPSTYSTMEVDVKGEWVRFDEVQEILREKPWSM